MCDSVMMDLRSHYENLLKQLFKDTQQISFRICFPLRSADISSGFVLALARFYGTSATVEYHKIYAVLESHGDFQNIGFHENGNILTWDVPLRIWGNQLEELYKNLQADKKIPFINIDLLSREELFQLQYVYARIHSVYKHFIHRFPKEKILSTAKFSSESMKNVLNLIKVVLGYSGWVKDITANEDFRNLRKYPITLITVFNELWDQRNDGAEMIFVFPNDLQRTRAEIFVLECLKQVLRRVFAALRVNPVEELRECVLL